MFITSDYGSFPHSLLSTSKPTMSDFSCDFSCGDIQGVPTKSTAD